MNNITYNFTGPVKAVVINHGDHAYDQVFYDPKTLQNLENDLYKIDDYLTRLGVFQNLWYHVMDKETNFTQT